MEQYIYDAIDAAEFDKYFRSKAKERVAEGSTFVSFSQTEYRWEAVYQYVSIRTTFEGKTEDLKRGMKRAEEKDDNDKG